MIGDIWYRYTDDTTRENEWSDPKHEVILIELTVIAETPHTVVLARLSQVRQYCVGGMDLPEWVERKRVLKDARKRWAYPTKALALNSYRVRKDYQLWHLKTGLERAQACRAAVALVEGFLS